MSLPEFFGMEPMLTPNIDRYALLLTALPALLAVPLGARADTADGAEANELPAVIVTAEKRATSLEETSVAVTAVSADTLASEHLQDLRDLNGDVAGLLAPGAIQNMQALYIRGIGTADPGTFPAVAVYMDDVYIPRVFGAALYDLPDLERVEVLRGPQGTLYGMNSSGGAVRYVSKDPLDQFQGSIDAGYGSYGSFDTHGHVTGPLIDGVLDGSIAYARRDNAGYTHDPVQGRDLDTLRTDQARAKLRWTPDFGLTAVLAVDGLLDRSDNASYISLTYPGSNPRTTFAGQDVHLHRENGGISLQLEYPVNSAWSIKSVSAVRTLLDSPSPWDEDGTPQTTYGWTQWLRDNEIWQDLQVVGTYADLTFTGGASYLHDHFDFRRLTYINSRYTDQISHLLDENYGVYGDVTWHILGGISVNAGLRYYEDQQTFEDASSKATAAGVDVTNNFSVSGLNQSWNGLTPKVALNYQATPDVFSYVSWTNGEKSGGYNRSAATFKIATYTVEPEKVAAYEVGLKARSFGGTLQNNLAIFYNRYDNYQATIANPVIDGAVVSGSVLMNAGKAHSYGVELETTALAAPGLELKFTGAYLNSAFDEFVNPTGAAISSYAGHKLPDAPKFNGSAAADYTIPWEVPGHTSAFVKYQLISLYYLDFTNTPQNTIHSQNYLDFGLQYATPRVPLTFALTVNNALDHTYRINGSFIPTIPVYTAQYNPPRLIMGTVRYNF
jgi:iron complex outermembrane receptor protein